MSIIIHSPYSFTETVSPCAKPSYRHILELSLSIIPTVPFHRQSLSSGSLSSSIQVINESIHDAPPIHERVVAIYKHRKVSQDVKQINNRKDDVLIALLRSGHHPFLWQYLHGLDPAQDPTYPNCRQAEQDLVHWLCDCPALLSVRQRVFVWHQGSLEWLATQPGDVVLYTRKTLVDFDVQPNNIKWLAHKHTHIRVGHVINCFKEWIWQNFLLSLRLTGVETLEFVSQNFKRSFHFLFLVRLALDKLTVRWNWM